MSVDPSTLSTVAQIGGTALQAFGSVKSGNAAAKAGEYDAAIADENARLSLLDGAYEESRIRREERAVSGEAVAAMGASGVQLGTGSALELLRENAYAAEFDALAARYSAGTQARAYRLDAERSRAGARDAKRAGRLGAGAAILSGISQFGSTRAVAKASKSGMSIPITGRR